MSRGARLARLRVKDAATDAVSSLSGMRGQKRVLVLAGPAVGVLGALRDAEAFAKEIGEVEFVLAPLVTDVEANERKVQLPKKSWVREPFAEDEWKKWYEIERDAARFKLGDAVDELLVVVVRRDGKVGARSAGELSFERLVAEARRLPKKDQYGSP